MLVFRALVLQVLPNEKLAKRQQRLYQTQIKLEGRRGTVFDRNGEGLAISEQAYSLYADPSIIQNRKNVAQKLASELKLSFREVLKKLDDPKKKFVWISRQLDAVASEKIKEWQIHGLGFIEEPKRVYLSEEIFAPVIGLVGAEGKGMEGVELYYDSMLKPNSEKITVKRDARGRPLQVNGLLVTEVHDGQDFNLTIDRELQFKLYRELEESVKEHNASGAYGIILDAETSEILAMSHVSSDDKPELRNRSLLDAFEPGSTLKTFVIAAALKEGKLKTNTRINCENGSMTIGKRTIHEADAHHKWGFLTVSEILAFSSNIGAAKIGFMLGAESFNAMLKNFGFGQKTGVDLPGESAGILQELPWSQHLLSNISFGHGVATTPLQIANAYASIANGGWLRTPRISKFENPTWWNRMLKKNKSTLAKRILTTEDANTLKLLLMGVTAKGGTGYNAQVPGYLVAGKTGTAQKVNPNGKGYLDKEYISSFVGFLPADRPRFVIYVAVDSPKKQYYGSQVAAPLFAHIASYALLREGLAPLVLQSKSLESSHVGAGSRANLNDNLTNANFHNNEIIKNLEHKAELQKANEIAQAQQINEVVPELRNITLREVRNILENHRNSKIDVKVSGDGNVVGETEPLAGQPWPDANHKIKLKMINR
jgi:cell division protein FtsI (penicillin-binding protein 3)